MEDKDLSRGRNNEVSKLAYKKARSSITRTRALVFSLIDGKRCTRAIEEMLGKLPHEISGRFTELKNSNKIYLVRKISYKGSTFSVYAKVA